jgi:nicotinate (nicotinamide) nucleotide adenylyltransferase
MLNADLTQERARLETLIERLNPQGAPQLGWVHRASKRITAIGGKLGVFSGSFNPMTVAHIEMIRTAQETYKLDEILLILAKANVDKGVFGLSLADRLLMLREYAARREQLSVAACSHGRFIEKVQALKPAYPPDTRISFIVGYDTLIRIFDPRYYTDLHGELARLFSQCRLIVANRQGRDAANVQQFLSAQGFQRYAPYIDPIQLPDFFKEISSTDIRHRMQEGRSIRHLVPAEIETFLKAINAYQTRSPAQNGSAHS